MRSFRSVALVVGLAVVISGCGSVASPAAAVNGASISRGDLDGELRAIAANDRYLKLVESQTPVRGTGKGAFDSAFTADVLTHQIVYQLVRKELQKRKIVVTTSDLAAARGTAVDQVDGEEVFRAFSKSYQDTLVRRVAEVNALSLSLLGQKSADGAGKAFYDAHPDQFEKACAVHILVATKDQADQVKARLDHGEDFGAVAQAVSQDPTSKVRGGDVGCFGRDGQLAPEFGQALFSQPVGAVGAPVESQLGFHIIKVTSRTTPPFEQVTAEARQKAVDAGQAELSTWLNGALAGAKVTVNPRYGHFEKGAKPGVVPPQAPTTLGANQSATSTVPVGGAGP